MNDDIKTQARHLYQLLERNHKRNIQITHGVAYLYENISVDFQCDYSLIMSELLYTLLLPTKRYTFYSLQDSHDLFLHDYISCKKDMGATINTLTLELIDVFKRDIVEPCTLFDTIYYKIPKKYTYQEMNFIIWGVIQELTISKILDETSR